MEIHHLEVRLKEMLEETLQEVVIKAAEAVVLVVLAVMLQAVQIH